MVAGAGVAGAGVVAAGALVLGLLVSVFWENAGVLSNSPAAAILSKILFIFVSSAFRWLRDRTVLQYLGSKDSSEQPFSYHNSASCLSRSYSDLQWPIREADIKSARQRSAVPPATFRKCSRFPICSYRRGILACFDP